MASFFSLIIFFIAGCGAAAVAGDGSSEDALAMQRIAHLESLVALETTSLQNEEHALQLVNARGEELRSRVAQLSRIVEARQHSNAWQQGNAREELPLHPSLAGRAVGAASFLALSEQSPGVAPGAGQAAGAVSMLALGAEAVPGTSLGHVLLPWSEDADAAAHPVLERLRSTFAFVLFMASVQGAVLASFLCTCVGPSKAGSWYDAQSIANVYAPFILLNFVFYAIWVASPLHGTTAGIDSFSFFALWAFFVFMLVLYNLWTALVFDTRILDRGSLKKFDFIEGLEKVEGLKGGVLPPGRWEVRQ